MAAVVRLTRPEIFAYQDYRSFLRAFFAYEKQRSDTFSYRAFSARAGFKSPNFLKLVIEGQRNLTLQSMRKVAAAFRLNPPETTFLSHLVELNQAETSSERRKAARAMYKSKVFQELYPLNHAELEYYENWYCIPIREMIGSAAFKEDPRWIARSLRSLITPQEATKAIETMLLIGLIRRNEHGQLEQAQRNVSTGHEVQSVAVASFHKQMIALAGNAIDEMKLYQREICGSTVLLSEESYHRLKELIQEFRRTLLAEAKPHPDGHEAVYQINIQFFPLSEPLHNVTSEAVRERTCKKAS